MTDFDLYGGFEPMMVYSLHCTKQWQKSLEFVIFYTGRQSHLCLSVFTFLGETELPPRQGTEAAGSSNVTKNTRTTTLYTTDLTTLSFK